MKRALFLLAISLVAISCGKDSKPGAIAEDGFDLAHSDPAAVELADSIMIAAGGRENWEKTRFISWSVDGRRWNWDKKFNRARIENVELGLICLVNLSSNEGRVSVKGQEITNPDSLKSVLKKAGYSNDRYQLAMPFMLKDSGIALKYLGEDTLKGGRYNVLQLLFAKAGETSGTESMVYPDTKLYVDVKEKLVRFWVSEYKGNSDTLKLVTPWDNYQKFGNILLSADRSLDAGPENVKVDENLPDKIFTEF